MNCTIASLPAEFGNALTYIPVIITVAAAAAAVLPHADDPTSTWGRIRAVLDVLAFNFGSARNALKKA